MVAQVSYTEDGLVDPSHFMIPGETFFESIVPNFKYEKILDQNESLRKGRAVVDIREVVELRLSHDRNYRPVSPVEAVYRTINGREITFAERWADQYRAFLSGDEQIVVGTPLEELKPYGITPAQISLCRAQSIQSIEALTQLEGVGRKRLGAIGNDLIPMAHKWEAARATALQAEHGEEIAALRAELAALKEAGKHPAMVDEAEQEKNSASSVAAHDDAYPDKSNDDLKVAIAEITGARPRGNPSRETLIKMLEGADS